MKREETRQNNTVSEGPFDGQIIEALERRPEIAIPADFAARVMSQLPERQREVRLPREQAAASVARTVAYVSMAATSLAFLLLAEANPAAMETGRGAAFMVEMLLVAELLSVGLWLGTQSGT